jgi:outer membrane protein insertion porin family
MTNRLSTAGVFLLMSLHMVALQGQANDLPIATINIQATDTLSYPARTLARLMKLKAARILSRGTPFSRRALRVDAISIRNFYISNGYLEANVVDSFAVTSDNQVGIYLTVTQGQQFLLESAIITGNRLLSQDEIIEFLSIMVGQPYNPVKLRSRLESLRHFYQDRGKLTIDIMEELESNGGIHLQLSIFEGLTYSIGGITIIGLEKIPEYYVRRELLFQTGDTFNRSDVLLSKQRVFESGLFGSVEIIPTIRAVEPGIADMEVRVRELERRSIELSAGFRQTPPASEGGSPNTALNSSVQWWHSRIFSTSVRTGITVESNITWGNLWPPDFLVAWDIITPWTFDLRLPTSIRIYSDYRTTPWTVRRNGIDLSFLSRRVRRSEFRGSLGWVFIEAGDDVPEAERTKGAERSIKLEYLFRGVDNFLTPKEGTIFQFKPSLHGTFIEDVRYYYKIEADIRRYHPIIWETILAYRLKVGYLETLPFGSARGLTSFQRYDLGGSTTLRGWERPSDFSDEGGIARGLINVEIRAPLVWILGFEAFIDAGTLRIFRDDPGTINTKWLTGWDVGAGLTLSTPLGPIRVDMAFKQGEDSTGEPTYQVAFLHTF